MNYISDTRNNKLSNELWLILLIIPAFVPTNIAVFHYLAALCICFLIIISHKVHKFIIYMLLLLSIYIFVFIIWGSDLSSLRYLVIILVVSQLKSVPVSTLHKAFFIF